MPGPLEAMTRRISQSWSTPLLENELVLQIAVVVLVELEKDLILKSGSDILYVGVVDGEETFVALVDHELEIGRAHV